MLPHCTTKEDKHCAAEGKKNHHAARPSLNRVMRVMKENTIMHVTGLHHVTAITGNAPENVRFYTQTLGLRLVKKTVNQDDVSAYHLFYGDEIGSAGTEVTFFDWPHAQPNVPGIGSLTDIALRAPGRDALDWWVQRFDAVQVRHSGIIERNGRAAIAFADPEGQRLLLVDDGGAPGSIPWRNSPVPPEYAIRGLYSITIIVRHPEPLVRLLTDALGMHQTGEYRQSVDPARQVIVFAVGAGGPGAEVHVAVRPDLSPAQVGIGGIHHVAFRVPDDETHLHWQQRLTLLGLRPTPVIDRYYFRSVYFRVSPGVLFEIATDGPGFATDEDPAHLGERLALPPFLEPHRTQIEAGLQPL
jgi:glyoxalase family protein